MFAKVAGFVYRAEKIKPLLLVPLQLMFIFCSLHVFLVGLFVLKFYGPVNQVGGMLLPETVNCPFCISGRERMTLKNIS